MNVWEKTGFLAKVFFGGDFIGNVCKQTNEWSESKIALNHIWNSAKVNWGLEGT